MPLNDAAYRNIFVQFFPAQCGAICPQRNLPELFFACVAQQFETGGGETYLAAIREFDENDATRHPDAGVLCTSHPRRFEGRVQIQVVAVIEEIFTQGGNVNVSTNTHCYDDGKHGCAGVWCWVGVGLELFDIDTVLREKSGQIAHNAGVIHGHHFHSIRNRRLRLLPLLGPFVNDGET